MSSLAQRLNDAKVIPSFCLMTPDGNVVDNKDFKIGELGCYAQYPLSDAKIYVIDENGEEAQWDDDKWYDAK